MEMLMPFPPIIMDSCGI